MSSQIQSITDLRGPAGRLEALLNTGSPHARDGGTMHNKVVYHAMKAFAATGLPTLRFNFRSAGLSEGLHDDGRGEVEDVRAALDYLTAHLRLPILFAGFSFGANVGLRACCGDPRVAGMVGLGLPVRAAGRDYTYHFLPQCTAPKLFVTGDHDQFAPRDIMEEVLTTAPEPKQFEWITGADHFFQGIPGSPTPKLLAMQTHISTWLAFHFPRA